MAIVRCVNCGTRNSGVYEWCYYCEQNMYIVAPPRKTFIDKLKEFLRNAD